MLEKILTFKEKKYAMQLAREKCTVNEGWNLILI